MAERLPIDVFDYIKFYFNKQYLSKIDTTTISKRTALYSAKFSPDGLFILSIASCCTVKLFNLSGECIFEIKDKYRTYDSWFSPNGQLILTITWHTGTVKIWTLAGECIVTLINDSTYQRNPVFSPNGQNILYFSERDKIKIWNLRNDCINTITDCDGALEAIFSPNGQYILSKSYNIIKIFDVNLNKFIAIIPTSVNYTYVLEFFPNGKYFISYNINKTINIFNLLGECIITFDECCVIPTHTSINKYYDFSSDSQHFLYYYGKIINIFNVNTKNITPIISASEILSAIFSPDCKKVLSQTDKNIQLWDLERNCIDTIICVFNAHKKPVFSYDGQLILYFVNDRTIKIVNLDGKCIKTLNNLSPNVTNALFSPNSNTILYYDYSLFIKLLHL
jgi:WD40 repeat protein